MISRYAIIGYLNTGLKVNYADTQLQARLGGLADDEPSDDFDTANVPLVTHWPMPTPPPPRPLPPLAHHACPSHYPYNAHRAVVVYLYRGRIVEIKLPQIIDLMPQATN
jgi:hypothetical protein